MKTDREKDRKIDLKGSGALEFLCHKIFLGGRSKKVLGSMKKIRAGRVTGNIQLFFCVPKAL